MESIYYIYCYYDTRTEPHTPIYIGRGKNKRYLQHYTKTHNLVLASKLKQIKEETNKDATVLKLEENLTNEQANEKEIYYINLYGRLDLNTGTLCNLCDGGKATDGWKPSEDTRKLWSQQRKGKQQTEAQYKANCSRTLSQSQKDFLKTSGKQFVKGYNKSKEQSQKEVLTKISKRLNLIGIRFGCLLVTEDTNESHRQKVRCLCDCGNDQYEILVCELKRKKNLNCNKCNSFKLYQEKVHQSLSEDSSTSE